MRHTPIGREHAAAISDRSSHCRRSRDRQSSTAIQDVSDAELARCRAEIAKLLSLWPRELADMSPAVRAHVVAALKRVTKLPLDVHLMITEPDRYIEAFAKAGAAMITVHQEVSPHLHRTLTHVAVPI